MWLLDNSTSSSLLGSILRSIGDTISGNVATVCGSTFSGPHPTPHGLADLAPTRPRCSSRWLGFGELAACSCSLTCRPSSCSCAELPSRLRRGPSRLLHEPDAPRTDRRDHRLGGDQDGPYQCRPSRSLVL